MYFAAWPARIKLSIFCCKALVAQVFIVVPRALGRSFSDFRVDTCDARRARESALAREDGRSCKSLARLRGVRRVRSRLRTSHSQRHPVADTRVSCRISPIPWFAHGHKIAASGSIAAAPLLGCDRHTQWRRTESSQAIGAANLFPRTFCCSIKKFAQVMGDRRPIDQRLRPEAMPTLRFSPIPRAATSSLRVGTRPGWGDGIAFREDLCDPVHLGVLRGVGLGLLRELLVALRACALGALREHAALLCLRRHSGLAAPRPGTPRSLHRCAVRWAVRPLLARCVCVCV